jgi:hypothetical protein
VPHFIGVDFIPPLKILQFASLDFVLFYTESKCAKKNPHFLFSQFRHLSDLRAIAVMHLEPKVVLLQPIHHYLEQKEVDLCHFQKLGDLLVRLEQLVKPVR